MDLKNIGGTILFSAAVQTVKELLIAAVKSGANLYGADLSRANLSGAKIDGEDVAGIRVFSGLYDYQIWAILYADGRRAVWMGCLHYSLENWESVGIRKSNLSEFPDDGSDKCEQRVLAFEFAKATVLRRALPAVTKEVA